MGRRSERRGLTGVLTSFGCRLNRRIVLISYSQHARQQTDESVKSGEEDEETMKAAGKQGTYMDSAHRLQLREKSNQQRSKQTKRV